ncbi:GntR family transcriptional regulator [Roseateles sp. NT4]|uniref:GntR family transcriptional regulator n=1 Tax=Roseateles sp. NT4 TaxID=3453715 RepID=UPI003EECDEB3
MPHPTTALALAQRLRQEINEGAWPPGEVLRQEELAVRYGASRIPVREALQLLGSEGLIEVVPNRGAHIPMLSAAQLTEIFELRLMLETFLLTRAIDGHTPKTLVRLEAVQAELELEDSRSGWLAGDRSFHETLYEPAHKPQTLQMVMQLRGRVERFALRDMGPDTRRTAWGHEHRALIAAVKQKDAAAASTCLAEHLNETHRAIANHLAAPNANPR